MENKEFMGGRMNIYSKRIVFVYSKYEREHWNIELIKQQLIQYKCKVYEIGVVEPDLLKKLLHIRPQIVVTFPITILVQIEIFTIIKKLLGSIIVTFTTEGLLNFNDRNSIIKLWAGNYDYSPDLVDYHVYWGKLQAQKIGKELFLQHKLKSSKQIRVFGNPMYEKEKIQSLFPHAKYDSVRQGWKNSILILTGFFLSEYTLKDIINAQDIVNIKGRTKKQILADPVVKETLEAVDNEKIYCQKYIDAILDAAGQNEDTLFVIKLHPIEIQLKRNKKEPEYIKRLKNIKNIFVIDDSWPIGGVLCHCSLMVHYGSTVDLEAYMYEVPTLKLEYNIPYNGLLCSTIRLTSSTYYENIDDKHIIDKYVKGMKNGTVKFKKNEQTEKQLEMIMNYKMGCEYNPSAQMAQFLCSNLHKNKLHLSLSEWNKLLKKMVGLYKRKYIK